MSMTTTRRIRIQNRFLHLVLLCAVAVTLAPFIWIVLASFKTQISLLMGQVRFSPVLLNYQEILFGHVSTYGRNFLNSVFISTFSTIIVVITGFLAAYSLFRMKWHPYVIHIFLVWSLVFTMVPPIALAGAWYELFRSIGLQSDYLTIVLAHSTLHLPMAIWLLSSFMKEVPRELEEAALIDGASFLQLVRRVVVPVMAPGLVSTALLVFIFSWNEFPVALALSSNDTATVPIGIAKYAQENEIKYTQMAAASVLSAIPALLALIFGQRMIVKGLTAGAVK